MEQSEPLKACCVGVYADTPALRAQINSALSQTGRSISAWSSLRAFQEWLKTMPSVVAVMALPEKAPSKAALPSTRFYAASGELTNNDFDDLCRDLQTLREHSEPCHAIVVTPRRLSLPESCQLVLAGAGAILVAEEPQFAPRLQQLVEDGVNFVARKRRQKEAAEAQRLAEEHGLIGASPPLRRLLTQARRAAVVSDVPVIIYGESGTGKQRIAELIHHWDKKRGQKPFVSVNCAAIAGSLAESELFGHRRGAFTGATEDRAGYFRAADGGTILLDEVSELSPALQPKILRVLQEGLVLPVGSDREYAVDVRVIAATNRELPEMVAAGKFRLDLYQRLNVIHLTAPPLRERAEDVPLLFDAFVQKYAHYSPFEIKSVNPAVYDVVARAVGQGNVRELENIVRQVLIFKDSPGPIEIADLPRALLQSQLERGAYGACIDISDEVIETLFNGQKNLNDFLEDCERVVLERLVARGLNQTALAQRLGVTRRTLYNKLEKHDLR